MSINPFEAPRDHESPARKLTAGEVIVLAFRGVCFIAGMLFALALAIFVLRQPLQSAMFAMIVCGVIWVLTFSLALSLQSLRSLRKKKFDLDVVRALRLTTEIMGFGGIVFIAFATYMTLQIR